MLLDSDFIALATVAISNRITESNPAMLPGETKEAKA